MNELTKAFVKWMRENYNVHFTVEEKDQAKFNECFPDLKKGIDYETVNNCTERLTDESR